MERTDNEIERRILGVLVEKSLAQPDYYPMTLKAVVAACNQKQNRNPVMFVDEDTVYNALEDMRERGVSTVVLPGAGARSKKYKHNIVSYFGWKPPEQAVMAELLLRGPETLGELRTRCSRMVPFDSLQAVTTVLDQLAACDPPITAAMPRVPGQSAIRYRQLLYDEPNQPDAAPVALGAASAPPTQEGASRSSAGCPTLSKGGGRTDGSDFPFSPPPSERMGHAPDRATDRSALLATIEELRTEIVGLRETTTDLQRRLAFLENQLL